MSLAAAITARWNATGLDTAIKPIFQAAGGPDEVLKIDDASPTKEGLPRARFVQMDAQLVLETSSCKQYEHGFFIYVYSKVPGDLVTYRELIRQKFENSYKATVAPFSITDAEVSVIELMEFQDSPRAQQTNFAELYFVVSYQVLKVLPS